MKFEIIRTQNSDNFMYDLKKIKDSALFSQQNK